MTRLRSIVLGLALTTGACASSPPAPPTMPRTRQSARIESIGAADVLFDQARALVAEGSYVAGCSKYEESLRLDHSMVTQYWLGDCYEKVGRVASAWNAFVQVAAEARQRRKPEHEGDARDRAQALKARLPKLTIVVPGELIGQPGLQIQRDGVVVDRAVWNQPVPVDPGEHTISATSRITSPWTGAVSVEEGETKVVRVGELDSAPMPPNRVGALVAGGVAVTGLVVGTIFGVRAFSQWDEALAACGVERVEDCTKRSSGYNPAVETQKDAATTSATLSTVGFGVGAAAAVAAGVLWFALSSESQDPASTGWRITPAMSSRAGGLILERGF